MTIEFTPWPKTPRLFRDAVITEKIDGTNAAVVVQKVPFGTVPGDPLGEVRDLPAGVTAIVTTIPAADVDPDFEYLVAAQSRKRIVTPGKDTDNHGFAAWVEEHASALVATLREGVHFGEWWGHGIQRGYGLEQGDRRFSLFNVHRYGRAIPVHPSDPRPRIPGLGVVPVLDRFTFDTTRVEWSLNRLREEGSSAVPGFMRPEGVVVFHSQSGQVFKALLDNDDISKTEAGAA